MVGNLKQELLDKIEASGFTTSEICRRAGVSKGTITKYRNSGEEQECSLRVYRKMISAIEKMIVERNQRMRDHGLIDSKGK